MGNKPSFMLQDEEITLISEETGFTPSQIERLYSRFTTLDKGGNGSLSRQDCLAIPELAINPLCDRIVQMFFIDCDDDHERINFRQFMKVLAIFRSSSHKSSPQSRSRDLSRQESLNSQQKQSIEKQAHLLFDSIDPSSFSSTITRHSRHSSFHDGFNDTHQHYTTNQHSFHYNLSSANGFHHHQHQHHSFNNYPNGNNNLEEPLVDPDEPANSMNRKMYFMFKVYDVNSDNLIDLEDLIAVLKLMVGTYVEDARVRNMAERTLREADKNCDGYIDFKEFCGAFTDIDYSLRVKF